MKYLVKVYIRVFKVLVYLARSKAVRNKMQRNFFIKNSQKQTFGRLSLLSHKIVYIRVNFTNVAPLVVALV